MSPNHGWDCPETEPASPGIRTGIPPSVPRPQGARGHRVPKQSGSEQPEHHPSVTELVTEQTTRQRATGHQHGCIFGAGSTRPRDCHGAVQPPSPTARARPRHSGETNNKNNINSKSGGSGGLGSPQPKGPLTFLGWKSGCSMGTAPRHSAGLQCPVLPGCPVAPGGPGMPGMPCCPTGPGGPIFP